MCMDDKWDYSSDYAQIKNMIYLFIYHLCRVDGANKRTVDGQIYWNATKEQLST